ncbi:Multidrug/oligosaccharidyl-lipid/polysaccharide [Globisporangium polare]
MTLNSNSNPPTGDAAKPSKLKPSLSKKLPPFNAQLDDEDASSDRTTLLEKTLSLSPSTKKRGPTNYEEACSIWNMGWKVSLATFCRISLSSISAAFLGHLGSDALAASALAMIWTNGVQILIFGFAVSLCTMCGQAYGAKNYELVGIWLQLGLIFLTLFSIPVMISFFYVDHLLSFVTDDLEVLHLADTYARYLVPTVLPQAVYCAMRQYLQSQEIVTPATIISILSVGVCLVSNYVFIYGFGPIPALHFIGSPIAQCVASIFQPVALYVYAFWYKGYHKKTWYGFKVQECLQWERVKYFVSLSLGMTLNLALDEWVYNVVSSLAGSMGAMNLAANSVMFNLWGLIFAVYWGFGLPTQVRAANFLGANEPALAQQTLRVGFVLGGIAAALSALFVFVFRSSIISIFTPDLEVAAIINHTLPVFCVAVFVSGLHIILAAVVEAMSLASTLVRITCTGSWLVLLPSSYLLGVVWGGGLEGLWWGSVLGEGTKFVLMAYALLRIDWTEMALRAVKQSEGNVLDEQEMEEDVEMRVSFMSATTPTMSGRSPVVTIFSAPQQVHHHNRKDQRGSDMEEGAKFRSSSYGATE